MPRTSPEKLAAALRANLKRRKAAKAPGDSPEAADTAPPTDHERGAKAPLNPVEKAKTLPPGKG